jgi:hypothetical protein
LYIVDGDLDLLAFSRKKKIDRLYRLRVYSVENLLFEIPAMEEYCSFASPGHPGGACAASVNPNGLSAELNNVLLPYIVALAIARRFDLPGGVFAINPPSVANVVGGRPIGPCPTKVRKRIKEIVRAIVAAKGVAEFRNAKRIVQGNLARRRLDGVRATPGKYFALSYLNKRVEAAGGLSLQQRAIASFLARHIRFENEPHFKAVLRKTAR